MWIDALLVLANDCDLAAFYSKWFQRRGSERGAQRGEAERTNTTPLSPHHPNTHTSPRTAAFLTNPADVLPPFCLFCLLREISDLSSLVGSSALPGPRVPARTRVEETLGRGGVVINNKVF